MHRFPAELTRGVDIGLDIIDEADLAGGDADVLGRQLEELGSRLLMAQHGRVENAVEARRKPELVHQIGGAHMLLIGRKEHFYPRSSQRGEIVQQRMVEAGIVLEPVVDQRLRLELRRDPAKNFRKPRLQLVVTGDDIAPMGFEERLLQYIVPQPEISLQIGEQRQAIARPAVNQDSIDIDHQDFHAGSSSFAKCDWKVPPFTVAFKTASRPFFFVWMHVSLYVDISW